MKKFKTSGPGLTYQSEKVGGSFHNNDFIL